MGDEQLAFGPVIGNWGAGDIHMAQISCDRAFAQKADAKTIEQKAMEQGMQTLKQDGLRLVLAGMTSIDEVLRLTQSQHAHD